MSVPDPEGDPSPWRAWAVPLGIVAAMIVIAAVVVIVLTSGSSHEMHSARANSQTEPAISTTATSTSSTASITAPHELSTTTATPTTTAGSGAIPAGGPVPSGFAPTSFTAISDRAWWLIGSAPCAEAPCTSIVRTRDGGQNWVGIPAPRTSDVSQIRFADAHNGYAYGSELWDTHDGGADWDEVSTPAAVTDLAAGGGYVYAATSQGLLRSAVGSDDWSTVHTGDVASIWIQGPEILADAQSESGQPVLITSSDDGDRWTATDGPAGTVQCQFSSSDSGAIWALCATGTLANVWRSTDDGAHWRAVGLGSSSGAGESPPNSAAFAAASSTTAVLGDDELYRTTDAGSAWRKQPTITEGVLTVAYLGFTDPTHGVAIVTGQDNGTATGKLYVTSDAGASYRGVTIGG